jgi:hypothetical protein
MMEIILPWDIYIYSDGGGGRGYLHLRMREDTRDSRAKK